MAAYLRKRLRYWRLQADQEKIPLCPANVGDMMLPSDFLQTFPSPSWTIPKLKNEAKATFKCVCSKGAQAESTALHDCEYLKGQDSSACVFCTWRLKKRLENIFCCSRLNNTNVQWKNGTFVILLDDILQQILLDASLFY